MSKVIEGINYLFPPQPATGKDVSAYWSGGKDGKYFRCHLCGHQFQVGDTFAALFTNTPDFDQYSVGNPIVCGECLKLPNLLEVWRNKGIAWEKIREEYWYNFKDEE